MRFGTTFMVSAGVLMLLAGQAWAQDIADEVTVETLGPPTPHRVYVHDPVFPHLIAAKSYVVDGDSGKMLGQINMGYVPNMVLSQDGSTAYVTETFWSRGARGKRTDVLTRFDARTLEPTGELILPNGRFLSVPKRFSASLTTDGRYLLSFNMTPSTSVGVIDVRLWNYVGDIELPGCALALPTGDNSFASICADGTLFTATFDADGQAKTGRTEVFFDAAEDPVFEHPAPTPDRSRYYFISYKGMVHPVDFSGAEPSFPAAWSLLTDADKQENWRPGGWNMAVVHGASNRLFVAMHQGGEWTHKQAGEEVWVYDLASKTRVNRIHLDEHALTISVSQDNAPQLYALSETAVLMIHDADTGNHTRTVEALGDSPFLLHVAGE